MKVDKKPIRPAPMVMEMGGGATTDTAAKKDDLYKALQFHGIASLYPKLKGAGLSLETLASATEEEIEFKNILHYTKQTHCVSFEFFCVFV